MPLTEFRDTGKQERLVASGARTTSGDTGPLHGYGPMQSLIIQSAVSAASGTSPTLDVVVEDTVDGGATWNIVHTFAQATAVGSAVARISTPFSNTIRVRWTVGGTTPSFTFAVDSYAEASTAGR